MKVLGKIFQVAGLLVVVLACSLSQAQAAQKKSASNSAALQSPQISQPTPDAINSPIGFRVKTPDEETGISWIGMGIAFFLMVGGLLFWANDVQSFAGILFVLGLFAGFLASGQRHYYHYFANNQGYAPQQPISYPHVLHAGKLKIACLYCHYNAEKSDVASIPSVNVCMNCHSLVRSATGDSGPNPEISKLVKAWESRDSAAPSPVVWERVNKLPSFVRFSHRIHVANGIACQECHGPIQTMTRVRQASPLNMGWCINCHRLTKKEAPAHWKHAGGPLDCIVCHH